MRNFPRSFAAFLLALSIGSAGEALTARPAWNPGFPLRSGTSIILMWTPIPGATEYRVLKRTDESPFLEIYRGITPSHSDGGVPEDATVVYKVLAIVGGRETPPSPEARLPGRKPLPAPTFTGALSSDEYITLKWDFPPGTAFFNLYRATAPEGPYGLVGSLAQDTYTDGNVSKGTVYFYKVGAVDAYSRESALSPPVRASLRRTPADAAGAGNVVVRRVWPAGEFSGERAYPLNQPADIDIEENGTLLVLDRSSIQFFDPEGRYLRHIAFDRSWGLPGGIAIDRDGTILVPFYADRVVRRIDRTGALVGEIRYPPYRRDIPKGIKPEDRKTLPAAKGAPGEEAKEETKSPPPIPNNPNGIAVDAEGFYWIVDGVRSQLIKTEGTGKALAVIGRPPRTFDPRDRRDSDLPAARKVYFNAVDGKLYVILGVSTEIKVVDPKTARVVGTFGGLGTGLEKFQGIGALAFRKNGNILVLDPLMAVVKEFTPDFRYVATYADLLEKDKIRLSANLATSMALNEEIRTFYLTSTLGNRVYRFTVPEEPRDKR